MVTALLVTNVGSAGADSFSAGSVIFPTDAVWQDDGGLEIYGLVHTVLRSDVPVHWSIQVPKPVGGVDFSVETIDWFGGSLSPRDFAAGPWIVAAEDIDTETEILIDQWLLSHPNVNVYVATQPFNAPIDRTLIAAPSIAVFSDDGLSTLSGYLNAAAIPDNLGQPWPSSVPPGGDRLERPGIRVPEPRRLLDRGEPHFRRRADVGFDSLPTWDALPCPQGARDESHAGAVCRGVGRNVSTVPGLSGLRRG